MKRTVRVIVRFIFSIVFLFASPFIYQNLKTVNKKEINPIIKIEEYGFHDHTVYDSLLGKAKFENKIGEGYSLNFSCKDSIDYYNINVMIYEWEDKDFSFEYFKEQVEIVRQKHLKRTSGSVFSDTIVPKVPYDKAIEYMYPVDLNEWNVDLGYSTIDLHSDISIDRTSSFVVLMKDNKVMVIETTSSLFLNPNYIQMFNDLLKESNHLFQ